MSSILAFIVVACTLNVSDGEPPKFTTECKEVVEDMSYSLAAVGEIENPQYEQMNPMTCMMNARPMLEKFVESHPGLMPRKWTCKYVRKEQKI